MKAILVSDVNEFTYEVIKEWFTGDIILHMENNEFINFKDVVLKPIPERMKIDYDTIATCEVTEKVLAIGWNACIETILGEEE